MSQKAALKSIRAFLDSGNYEQAAENASDLCQQDTGNYNGKVFHGLALEKLNRFDESERAYQAAIKIKETDKRAWQGLLSLYEKQGSGKLDEYGSTVENLCHFFSETDEKSKAQDILDKYIRSARQQGSKLQYKHALQLVLPSSSIYDTFEETLPHPSQTYSQLIEISEADEKQFINREIGERRTRLGARIDQVTLEVKREAFQRSDLDVLYRGLIDWTRDDNVRRTQEEKLLTRAYEFLQVLPSAKKAEKREEVLRSARDMVTIKHPFELAWKITLEWKDVDDLRELDVTLLRDFISLFPDDGLSKVLKGFLASDISPFTLEAEDAKEGEDEGTSAEKGDSSHVVKPSSEEQLLLMAEGLEQSPSSILSHRIMGEVYLSLEEFQATVNVTRKALPMISESQRNTGLTLQKTFDAVNISLATSLISYQSPKNHPEAKGIFEDILRRKPMSTPCLLGIGLILEEDQDYAMAVDFLGQALKRDPENAKIRSELAWSMAQSGDLQSALARLEDALSILQPSLPRYNILKAEILYRIGYCVWELDASPASRKDRNGAYASFLASIQADINNAPAYTSLGIYYSDYKKDQKRARRCFHKAFELSSKEIMAAERLARDFAMRGDWELVEAVSQRVIDSGKAKPAPGSKQRGYSWPYAAIGIVEINRQQYTKSIVSFQAALRISPMDYQCWVGLGESYHNSGRYIAATKAFQQAESLEEDLPSSEKSQVWFVRYMVANVRRELGEYDDAISRYKEVLDMKQNEFGASLALLQTLVEASWKAVESGCFGEASDTAREAIETGTLIAKNGRHGVNLWKAIGDAFSIFTWIKGRAHHAPFAGFKQLLEAQPDISALEALMDVDDVGSNFSELLSEDITPSNRSICAAILSYKLALYISASDKHSHAVAWYNLGWAEHRAHKCWEKGNTGSKKEHSFRKAAMRSFKRAIELEAGNAEFWNALGVATTTFSLKVAQHSFVRSLHINDKIPQVWSNLGALYLIHNDYELANEAFTRAQSADPDFAHAWLGHGFLTLLSGEVKEARELFTHAFSLGNSSMVSPKGQYAMSVFDDVSTQTTTNDISHLIQPLFALHQLHSQEPSVVAFSHLSALIAERISDFTDAEASLDIASSRIEAEFESSESIASLCRYAQAKADMARLQLGRSDHGAAVDDAETALNLSKEGVADLDMQSYKMIRLSAHLTAGLGYYYLKDMDKSISMFREALEEAESDPDVVCLLAQVLWAKGGDTERSVAREQLFDCVEKYSDHVGAVTLLGAIAILDADPDAIEAVESDLRHMRTRDDIGTQDRAKITQLLAGICSSGLGEGVGGLDEQKLIYEANESVMISPAQPEGWMALSAVSVEPYPAEMAVKSALRSIPPRGDLGAASLSKAHAHTGYREDAIKAIMVAPWKEDGWTEFSRSLAGA